jgi:hypothetical protein
VVDAEAACPRVLSCVEGLIRPLRLRGLRQSPILVISGAADAAATAVKREADRELLGKCSISMISRSGADGTIAKSYGHSSFFACNDCLLETGGWCASTH